MPATSIQEVIAFAVKQEEEASRMYRQAMQHAPDQKSRQLLEDLASEELEHRELFAGISADGKGLASFTPLPGKLVSEFLADIPFREGMTFTEVMIYAMKKEEYASGLYRRLAALATDPRIAGLLNRLADVEHNHKVMLEDNFLVEVSNSI